MDTPAKGMLKVVSILLIIFGAVATVFSLLALTGTAFLFGYSKVIGGVLFGAMLFVVLVCLLELIIGIMGLKRSEDPERANFFIVTGVILGILALVSTILSFSIVTLIGLLLPVLYIIGGYMNKRGGKLVS